MKTKRSTKLKKIFKEAQEIYDKFNYLDGSFLDLDATPNQQLEHNRQIIEIAKMLLEKKK